MIKTYSCVNIIIKRDDDAYLKFLGDAVHIQTVDLLQAAFSWPYFCCLLAHLCL